VYAGGYYLAVFFELGGGLYVPEVHVAYLAVFYAEGHLYLLEGLGLLGVEVDGQGYHG